jgi:hypothetical protein
VWLVATAVGPLAPSARKRLRADARQSQQSTLSAIANVRYAVEFGVVGSPPPPEVKIERWHQTLKYRILLENYFMPGHLEAQMEAFVEY